MINKFKKGFTLVELLVVVAVIGILAAMILPSLGGARNKGKDARVTSDVNQIRLSLESGYDGAVYGDLTGTASSAAVAGSTTVTGTGPNNAAIVKLATDLSTQNGGTAIIYIVATNASVTPIANATAYAIYGKLASSAKYFCIDSNGGSNPVASAATTITCP